MKIFSTLLFAFLFTLISLATQAQTFPYLFVVETDTYANLEEAEELTSVGDFWDDPSYTIPLGFNFEFYGATFSTLFIDGLGNIVLFGDFYSSDTLNLIIPYIDDLADIEAIFPDSQSTISYTTEGFPGERIFKIEWKDAGFFNEFDDLGTANNRVTFQVWLYETSNNIEYRFGPSNIVNPQIIHDFGSPVCGILEGFFTNPANQEQTIEGLWYLAGDPANPTVELADNSILTTYNIDGLDAHPADGQVYRFINPAASVFSPKTNDLPVKIYPNLVEEIFYVEVDQTILKTKTQLVILNQLGQEVLSQPITDTKEIFDASYLASGIYYVSIFNENGRGTKRFVKQ
ncbi:MAG: T9SS type A sorting domain-containing protein [Bacteroidota bacterium]